MKFDQYPNIMKYRTRIGEHLHRGLAKVPALVIAVGAFLGTQQIQAENSSWDLDGAGNWSATGNWTSGIPGATSSTINPDIATFGLTLTANRTVTVDPNRNIGGITFSNTSGFGYLLTGGNLLLSNGGVIQSLATNGAHSERIYTNITIQGNGGTATFTNNATSSGNRFIIGDTFSISGVSTSGNTTTLALNGSNTGANAVTGLVTDGTGGGRLAIVKDGAGEWRLQKSNTFSGGVTLNAGTLGFTTSGAFGTGTLTINGGTLNSVSPSGSVTNTNAIIVGGNFGISQTGAPAVVADVTFAGNVDLTGGTRTVTVGAMGSHTSPTPGSNTLTFSGVISDGGLTKAGTGTLTLRGVNTYTGNTTVADGTLILAENSQTSFVIGANQVNNKILGTTGGTEGIILNGVFSFDLTLAGTHLMDTWNIVDMVNFTPIYGETFSVLGFTDIGGNVWEKAGATTYQFNEATGVLSAVPEPATWTFLAAGLIVLLTLQLRRSVA